MRGGLTADLYLCLFISHQHEANLRPRLSALHPAGDAGLLVLHQVVLLLQAHLHTGHALLDDQLRLLLLPVSFSLPGPGQGGVDLEELEDAGVVLRDDGVEE